MVFNVTDFINTLPFLKAEDKNTYGSTQRRAY